MSHPTSLPRAKSPMGHLAPVPERERFLELWVHYDSNITNVRRHVRREIHAAYVLGVCFVFGIAVKQNMKYGIELLRQASEAGLPEAVTTLAYCYENALGVERDVTEARGLRSYASLIRNVSRYG